MILEQKMDTVTFFIYIYMYVCMYVCMYVEVTVVGIGVYVDDVVSSGCALTFQTRHVSLQLHIELHEYVLYVYVYVLYAWIYVCTCTVCMYVFICTVSMYVCTYYVNMTLEQMCICIYVMYGYIPSAFVEMLCSILAIFVPSTFASFCGR